MIALETMLRGTCEPARLLDLVENFTLFMEVARRADQDRGQEPPVPGREQCHRGGATRSSRTRGPAGRVLAHPGQRQELFDDLLLARRCCASCPATGPSWSSPTGRSWTTRSTRTSLDAGVVDRRHAPRPRAASTCSSSCSEDHRYVFTLIHKFRTEQRRGYPVLSDRDDIIVITDEAHRSQYDTLAMNMRNALPNAAFLASPARR